MSKKAAILVEYDFDPDTDGSMVADIAAASLVNVGYGLMGGAIEGTLLAPLSNGQNVEVTWFSCVVEDEADEAPE